MTEYKGMKNAITGPIIAIIIFTAVIFSILYFLEPGYGSLTAAFIIFLLWMFAYKGIVLKITLDQEKIVIVRPFSRNVLKIENIAFCAVHGIDEDKSIIYAFMKKGKGSRSYVKGIKPAKPFEEIVRLVSDEKNQGQLDVNFNMAAKIPVSFVEKGEELKEAILTKVSGNQRKIVQRHQ